MKKIITLSILLSTAHAHSMKPEEKVIALGLVSIFAASAAYEAFIKDPNVKLAEKYTREQESGHRMIAIGNNVQGARVAELNQLKAYLATQPNTPANNDLQKYVSQQIKD